MDTKSDKQKAIDSLLDLGLHSSSNNRYSERLRAAFPEDSGKAELDLERMRVQVLAKQRRIEAERRKWRRHQVPFLAAATVLLAAGMVFWFGVNGHRHEGEIIASVNTGVVTHTEIAQSLTLNLRATTGISRKQEGDAILLSTDAISGVFDFTPKRKSETLTISLPGVTFEVVGTKFILECSGGSFFLAVDHGAVRVTTEGKQETISTGNFWSQKSGRQVSGSFGSEGKLLFSRFNDASISVSSFVEKILIQPQRPKVHRESSTRAITVTLKSGSVVRGELLSGENGDIEMQTPSTGSQIMRFKREEIAGVHYHYSK